MATNSTALPKTPATTRIQRRFEALGRRGEMGLVAFITAGDPSLEATESFVLALDEAGADIVELGVPFSDPVADGPAIQRSSERALRAGATLSGAKATCPWSFSATTIRCCKWASNASPGAPRMQAQTVC